MAMISHPAELAPCSSLTPDDLGAWHRCTSVHREQTGGLRQAQPPPQPAGAGADIAAATSALDTLEPWRPPVDANTDRSLTASGWPDGHVAGADASLMGRRSSNTASHVRQRNS
jgi:hypothetical protein